MQATQSSQKVGGGAGSGGKSGTTGKPSKTLGTTQSSRTRNTSDSGQPGGGRTLIFCDGRNVTPKSLAPSNPNKDSKPDDDLKQADAEGGEGGAAADEAAPPPPPPTKGKATKAQGLTKEELDRNVDLILTETETDTLLHFP